MKISSESFFSKLKSKSKFLDGKEKRLRLREERLIKSESEAPRVSVNDFFGINQKTGSPLGKKKLNIKESMDIIQKITKREDGGPVEKGEPYLVGEKGPEIVTPDRDGFVIPNNQIDSLSLNNNSSKILIQPITTEVVKTQPMPVPVPKVVNKTKFIKKNQLPESIARMIK